jgi:hypothetical protein
VQRTLEQLRSEPQRLKGIQEYDREE